ncbi:hypothetical protein [Streptomyces sp. NPDC047028]|uniref:hypothetical protein n=1 Tax=Streptomyces sp. NPDC047028 TaxID=3155793 RepID=UPI0033C76D5D
MTVSPEIALLGEYLARGNLPAGLVAEAQSRVRQEPAGALPSGELAAFLVLRAMTEHQWSSTDFTRPLDNAGTWLASETLMTRYPQFTYQLETTLEALGNLASKRGAVDGAMDELENLDGYFSTLRETVGGMPPGEWPALWSFRSAIRVPPGLFCALLGIGSDALRAAVAALVEADLRYAGGQSVQDVLEQARRAHVAEDAPGVSLDVTEQVARAVLLGEWEAEAFTDPLGSAENWADSRVVQRALPDFHREVVQLLQARVRRDSTFTGTSSYPEAVLSLARYLSRIARTLMVMEEGWPEAWAVRGKLPVHGPAAVVAMIDEGLVRLRSDLGSAPSGLPQGFPAPTLTSGRLDAPRSAGRPGTVPPAVSHFPSWQNVRGFAHSLAADPTSAEDLVTPLAHLERWRGSATLREEYPEFVSFADDIHRFGTPVDGRTARDAKAAQKYGDALGAFAEALRYLRRTMGILGRFWPDEWWSPDMQAPADSPEVVQVLLEAGEAETEARLGVWRREDSTRQAPARTGRLSAPLNRFRGRPGA